AVAVRGIRVDLRAHHQLAAVGLADVDVHGGRDDDFVQKRLQRLGHTGLQWVRGDGQVQPYHLGDGRAMPRRGVDDGLGLNLTPGGYDRAHVPVLARDARDLGLREDGDAATVR